MTDKVEACIMVSAAMPEPKEGEPGWVPSLENWPNKGGLKRRIVLVADSHIGEWGEKHEWFPEKLEDAILWLQGILDQVPVEYRDQVEIKVDCDVYDPYEGSEAAYLRISYLRDPTSDELARWNRKSENETVFQIQRDMKELERLKKKLGLA